ncbi:unnamed protein product [Dicrocoelium dendriticum]|nr:unnamed protein product [Dicrocoelium dendriticum]
MLGNTKAEGLGSTAFWGFTPAINLREYYEMFFQDHAADSMNILLVGSSDSRHLLRTISDPSEFQRPHFNFFVVDSSLEIYARYILQLYIAFEHYHRFNLQDKTELFLELFGNTLIREYTATYLRCAAQEFIRICTSYDCDTQYSPFFDLSAMKFKERDVLESIFKFWRDKDSKAFDISKCWDSRLRKHLGTRYDAIPNVFDWDCSITLHDRQANQIDSGEYSKWRRIGIAFELRKADYIVSNRSLASGKSFKTPSGEPLVYWGYWGDLTTSPFITFGIDTSKLPELRRQVNGKSVYGANVTSEANVRGLLWQLQHHRKCPLSIAAPFCVKRDEEQDTQQSTQDADEKDRGFVFDFKEVQEEKCAESARNSVETIFHTVPYARLSPPNSFSVKYLPINSFPDLPTRHRSLFEGESSGLLDVVYIGCSLAHLLNSPKLQIHSEPLYESKDNQREKVVDPDNGTPYGVNGLLSILKEKSMLVVESVLYLVELRPAEIEAYVENITRAANALGFQPATMPKPLEDHHLFFVRRATK